MVDPRFAKNGREYPRWNSDYEPNEKGKDGEDRRGGNALKDKAHGGDIVVEGISEIAPQYAQVFFIVTEQKFKVLDVEWFIEAHLFVELGNFFYGSLIGHQDVGRISRHVEHQEDNEKNHPQDDQTLHNSANDKGTHQTALEKPNGFRGPEINQAPNRVNVVHC